jgi:hypothetical protein
MKAGAIMICVLAAVLGIYVVPSQGSNARRQGNVEATRMYLAARYAALIETKRDMPLVVGALNRIVDDASGHCAGVAAAAPDNRTYWLIEVGVTETLLVAATRSYTPVIRKLDQRVSRLRWATPRLARLMRRAVFAAHTLINRKSPELCGYLREWARQHFGGVPQALRRFSSGLKQFSMSSEEDTLLSALRRYETGKARLQVEQVSRTVGSELRARIIGARTRLFKVIGLRDDGHRASGYSGAL